MPCFRMKMADSVAIVTTSGPTMNICSGGEEFLFEFHEFLGPSMIGKRGQPVESFPEQRSPFWDALYFWIKQGKQVDAEGNCIFKSEMQLVNILEQVGRNTFRVLA